MNWKDRLWQAAKVGRFSHRDHVDVFSRETNLLAEFGWATDEHGLALDAGAQELHERFGWLVLSGRIADAAKTYRDMAELSEIRSRGVAA